MKTKTLITALIAIVASLLISGCDGKKNVLYVYSWSDYFSPELIEKFNRENDCYVDITSFDSNEAMYAKLKAGGVGYDVLVPSSYLIPLLAKERIITPLNHELIPNAIGNFDHSLDGQVADTNMEWSVPYACTYTGLMYIRDKVDVPTSWKAIGDGRYFNRVSLMDDVRELVGIGLILNGDSLNSDDSDEVMEAASTVSSMKRNVRKFDSEAYKNDIASGSIWLGHAYSSDAAQLIVSESRSDIGFTLPNEGFTIAWDELVITSTSKNKELAHRFIDFFYDDENALENALYICSRVGNRNVRPKVPVEYLEFMYPKNIDRGQLLRGFSDESVLEAYNEAFDKIKSIKE